jgi:hypothetical protein
MRWSRCSARRGAVGRSRRATSPNGPGAALHPRLYPGLDPAGETTPAETTGRAAVSPSRGFADGAPPRAAAPLEAAPPPGAQLAAAPDAARPLREPADPPPLIPSAAGGEAARDPAAPSPGDRKGILLRPAAVPPAGAAPEMHVHIGRIEVTTVREAAPARARPPARQPPRSLAAYLATRDRT